VRIVDILRDGNSELRIEFITDVERLESLAAPWEALASREIDRDPAFFQSFAWSMHVARLRSARSASSYRVCVVKVLRGERLVGLWPLSLQRQSSVWLLRNLDDPFGQFAGAVFEDSSDITPSIVAIVQALRRERMADGMQIEGVIADSPLHRGLTAAGLRISASNEAVIVDLRPFPSFPDYTRTINAKTRKNLRNLFNRLNRAGPTTVVVATEPECIRKVIESSFTDRVQWLNDHGKTSTAFRNADFRPLVAALPDSDGIGLRAFTLLHDGNVIAQQWGFIHGDRYYAYISSRDPAFDAFSAGRIHLGHVIQSCYEDGLRILELMPPKVDYKMTWTDSTRRLDSFIAAFTVRGRLVLRLWLTHLEPALRRVSHSFPPRIRRKLAALVNAAG